jgi:hypothetical protein
MRIPVGHSRRCAPDALSTLLVLLALVLLGECASAGARGQDPRVRSNEMGPVPGSAREPEAPHDQLSRTGWAFGVRDDEKAEAVWVGAWTAEGCERLLAGFVARSRVPSRQMSGCRPLTFTAGPSGSQMWLMTSDSGFVASLSEATCNQAMARIMPNQERPSCAPVWVTFP